MIYHNTHGGPDQDGAAERSSMEHFNLEELAGGAFTEQINREIRNVMENIQDPNTDAKKPRKITVTITFKPNDKRNFIPTGVETKTTLAPALGVVTAISTGKNLKTGEVEAVEIGNQIPGQMSMDEVEAIQAVQERRDRQEEENHSSGSDAMVRTVDQSTGEIYETPASTSNNVIDLRAARQA